MSTSSAEARMEPTLRPGSENRTGTIEAAAIARDALGFVSIDPNSASSPQSRPKKGYLAVNEKELAVFVRFGTSASASVSALFLGIFIGFAVSAFGVFEKTVTNAGLTGMANTLALAVSALCFGISVIATLYSWRSRSENSKTIEAIRKRSNI